MIAATFVVVAISSVSREIIQLAAAPEYLLAFTVVPLVLIPTGLQGVSYCFQTGILIQKKTQHMLYIALGVGLVNSTMLFLLVPRFGMKGAAMAAICASFVGLTHTYIVSQRLCAVPYEYARVGKVLLAGAIVELVGYNVRAGSVWTSLALKIVIILAFIPALVVLRVFTASEIDRVRALLKQLKIRLRLSPDVVAFPGNTKLPESTMIGRSAGQ
jgi:O-antigen/teichoic acid export membrane protein